MTRVITGWIEVSHCLINRYVMNNDRNRDNRRNTNWTPNRYQYIGTHTPEV